MFTNPYETITSVEDNDKLKVRLSETEKRKWKKKFFIYPLNFSALHEGFR